jgi:hypothetical protein
MLIFVLLLARSLLLMLRVLVLGVVMAILVLLKLLEAASRVAVIALISRGLIAVALLVVLDVVVPSLIILLRIIAAVIAIVLLLVRVICQLFFQRMGLRSIVGMVAVLRVALFGTVAVASLVARRRGSIQATVMVTGVDCSPLQLIGGGRFGGEIEKAWL